MSEFEALGLSKPLLRALEAQKFTTPTEIQAAAIPHILEGSDVVGLAQTGSGKTAAFVLPLLDELNALREKAQPHFPKAVILAPTRELAQQIGEVVRTFSTQVKVSYMVACGGVSMMAQTKALKRGVEIVIATPGRLADLIRRKQLYLDECSRLIIDEADKMLEMGFIEEVMDFVKLMPETRQTTMFSATMNKGVEKLTDTLLNDPVRLSVLREEKVSANVTHQVYYVDYGNKRNLLLWLLKEKQPYSVLIFTRTKAQADELDDFLYAERIKSDVMHGDKKQRAREKALENFKRGKVQVLVATDVAARGIDVNDIEIVINLSLPAELEAYVHRVGRTGRGENKGLAISFCDRKDVRQLHDIEHYIKAPIDLVEDHPYHEDYGKGRAAGGKGRGSRNNNRSERRQGRGGRPERRVKKHPSEEHSHAPVKARKSEDGQRSKSRRPVGDKRARNQEERQDWDAVDRLIKNADHVSFVPEEPYDAKPRREPREDRFEKRDHSDRSDRSCRPARGGWKDRDGGDRGDRGGRGRGRDGGRDFNRDDRRGGRNDRQERGGRGERGERGDRDFDRQERSGRWNADRGSERRERQDRGDRDGRFDRNDRRGGGRGRDRDDRQERGDRGRGRDGGRDFDRDRSDRGDRHDRGPKKRFNEGRSDDRRGGGRDRDDKRGGGKKFGDKKPYNKGNGGDKRDFKKPYDKNDGDKRSDAPKPAGKRSAAGKKVAPRPLQAANRRPRLKAGKDGFAPLKRS